MAIGSMAKYGGYYYYVLPELKIKWYGRFCNIRHSC
jgi:hypothetical protein